MWLIITLCGTGSWSGSFPIGLQFNRARSKCGGSFVGCLSPVKMSATNGNLIPHTMLKSSSMFAPYFPGGDEDSTSGFGVSLVMFALQVNIVVRKYLPGAFNGVFLQNYYGVADVHPINKKRLIFCVPPNTVNFKMVLYGISVVKLLHKPCIFQEEVSKLWRSHVLCGRIAFPLCLLFLTIQVLTHQVARSPRKLSFLFLSIERLREQSVLEQL